MSDKETDKTIICYNGLGILSLFLTILFLILQLCSVIAWKWVFIFLPIIIYAGIWVVGFIICLVVVLVVACIIAKCDIDEYDI